MCKLKNNAISFPFVCYLFVLFTFISCKQDELQIIVLKTVAPTSSASVSPTINCEIVSSAGLPISKRGVCFSSLTNPTLLDGYVLSTSNSNNFSVQLQNLISNKEYYIRAFAMSGAMIYYGNTITYRTGSMWKQLSSFGGLGRFHAVGFSLNGLGYIGTGYTGALPLNDFWEYNPFNDIWSQRADFGGIARLGSFCLTIENKAYVGTGYAGEGASAIDFWEYNSAINEWTKKADDIGIIGRFGASSFVINGKGYVGTGDWGGNTNNFWEYNPSTNSWTQIANFGGTARKEAVGFSINEKGYVGTGVDDFGYKKDFWEYDPLTNTWIQKADFPGLARSSAVGFAIGSKGYIGTGGVNNGTNWTFYSDFWEYDLNTNSWRQIEGFGGGARFRPVAFVISNKAYVGTGNSIIGSKNDLWEFSPQ